MPDRRSRTRFLVIVTAIAMIGLLFAGRIPQDLQYHQFADTRKFGGIVNFWNVFSNLPFVLMGLFGISRYPRLAVEESRCGHLVLCTSVILVGIGSAYYHHAPSNSSLLWDRLPMTVAFMALLSMLLGERVITSYKKTSLWLLVAIGIGAALYWSWTEARGQGDLRPYVLVQFLPILLIALILFLFPTKYLRSAPLLCAFGLYFLAKTCEHFDHEIFGLTNFVSGHTLKHVLAAFAVLCIVCAVPARGPTHPSRDQANLREDAAILAAERISQDGDRHGQV